MSTIKTMRDTLAADLAPLGVPVHPTWPLRAEAPSVFLAPPLSGSYVTGGPQFGSYVLNLDVVVLVERRPPDEGREALELLTEQVLTNTADWGLLGVDAPAALSVTDATIEFFGTVVHLSKTFHL